MNEPCTNSARERRSVEILLECADLQKKKSRDYQNPASTVKQADYYDNGLITIYDIMHAKMLRIKSVMQTAHADLEHEPNFESLQDSFKDLINYASFGAAYIEGKVPGQISGRDMFNREIAFKIYEQK